MLELRDFAQVKTIAKKFYSERPNIWLPEHEPYLISMLRLAVSHVLACDETERSDILENIVVHGKIDEQDERQVCIFPIPYY